VIAFFDLTGKRVVRYTGATSDAEEFMLLGEFVVSGAYKDTSFTRFKRDKRKASG
jgi:thioredoxin-related protein